MPEQAAETLRGHIRDTHRKARDAKILGLKVVATVVGTLMGGLLLAGAAFEGARYGDGHTDLDFLGNFVRGIFGRAH